MRSNYKRIGNYIREVSVRNSDLKTQNLLGINIDKFFMSSVANIVGTDMSVYKVVKKGQFACNRMHVGRDYRLPVALSDKDESFIVSPAYDVFEIIDPKELIPEYLMMWFSRSEFDRNAWFYTDADVRGGLPWKSFCDMKLPVPHPDKQRELVKKYNTIVNRINLNNQLIQKLEETAQAIYKQWFVDFEFPDENGRPYKSSGGKMEWCEELRREIPERWRNGCLSDLTQIIMGQSPDGESYNENGEGIPLVNGPAEFGEYLTLKKKWTTEPTKLSKLGDLIICVRGSTTGRYVRSDGVYCLGRGVCSLRASISQCFIDQLYKSLKSELLSLTTGSTFPNWDGQTLANFNIVKPQNDIQNKFENTIRNLEAHKFNLIIENKIHTTLLNIQLSKLTILNNKP